MYAQHAWRKDACLLNQYLQNYIEVSQSLEIASLDRWQRGSLQPSEFQKLGADVPIVLWMANIHGTRRAQIGY